MRTTVKWAMCAVSCSATWMLAESVIAQTTLQVFDPYTVSANSNDINFEISRQSGTLAPKTYTESGPAHFQQVGNGGSPGRLLIAADNTSSGRVSLNQNFNQKPGAGLGSYNFIRFDVDQVTATSTGQDLGSWAAVTMGTSAASQNAFVNASDGFGILLRGNGGFQAFDGGTVVGAGSYTSSPSGMHAIEAQIFDLVDFDPWNGVGTTQISLFADGSPTPFFTFTKGSGGYLNNYITLLGNRDSGGLTIHDFDNLAVGFVSLPEPATWAMWCLGGLVAVVFSAMRLRRRAAC